MKKDAETIAGEIISLVSELAALAGAQICNKPAQSKMLPLSGEKDRSGATGGVRLLVEDGKLDSPKSLSEIAEFLKQEGRHYSKQTVSMGLLNLVRERTLIRLKDKGEKGWKYAVRR
ncbi:MAG: hypothetical protein ABSC89_10750 [Verrucomicrobiota bacterium]|jgi:hypothetical protein